ncbi:PilW family protein [Bacillus sp. S/N-304-OC-R1]|uniref:PilW family protein n=1 Tax=Bacillus sp. S/N-304-OC-R1 TaxID=2758034 RepID=UPI001C8E1D6C|nr:type II secretion system protein [Bacillus sp. S/N-304-OC-R1]MBY0123970.1 type II secretion system protein [Bacillus sp. S/N-304-OC-R1]
MDKPELFYKKNGFTLVELLCAITLLSFVIIIYLSIFSQSLSLSRKVEDKLTSVNVAEKVLNMVRRGDANISFDTYPYELPKVNGKTYYPVVVITQTSQEQALGLKKVLVKIYSNKDYSKTLKPDSEIYGYIELEN